MTLPWPATCGTPSAVSGRPGGISVSMARSRRTGSATACIRCPWPRRSGWARSAPDVVVVDAVPRYLPGWSRPVVQLPGLREFLTWNLLPVMRCR